MNIIIMIINFSQVVLFCKLFLYLYKDLVFGIDLHKNAGLILCAVYVLYTLAPVGGTVTLLI